MVALGLATLVCGVAVAIALAIDKRRATRGAWRVSERTLHTLELCGGWAGSLIARRLLRHKTRKGSYRVMAAAIALLHAAAWVLLLLWAFGLRW
jgi:uncharacterized membrane protein YsdA (DUF1294 family)